MFPDFAVDSFDLSCTKFALLKPPVNVLLWDDLERWIISSLLCGYEPEKFKFSFLLETVAQKSLPLTSVFSS